MIFPDDKEVLWDFKESCHMKSGVKQWNRTYLCLGSVLGFSDVPQWGLPRDLWRYFHLGTGELWVEQPLAPFPFPLLGSTIFEIVFLIRSNEMVCQNKEFPCLLCIVTFLVPVEKTGFKVKSQKLEEALRFVQWLIHKGCCRSVA